MINPISFLPTTEEADEHVQQCFLFAVGMKRFYTPIYCYWLWWFWEPNKGCEAKMQVRNKERTGPVSVSPAQSCDSDSTPLLGTSTMDSLGPGKIRINSITFCWKQFSHSTQPVWQKDKLLNKMKGTKWLWWQNEGTKSQHQLGREMFLFVSFFPFKTQNFINI